MSVRRAAFAAFVGCVLLAVPRAASPCPRVEEAAVTLAAAARAVPKDAFFPVRVTADVGADLRAALTSADGAAIATRLDTAADGTKLVRAASGELPVGKGRLLLHYTHSSKQTAETASFDVEITNERAADLAFRVHAAKITPVLVGDPTALKIACHPPVSDCGSSDPLEIASRAKKAPTLSFDVERPAWAIELFEPKLKYTVVLDDGRILEEPARGFGHTFERIGVEYCVELTMTPRWSDVRPRTSWICAPNGAVAYAVTEADHERHIVESSQSYQCASLEFPDGVDVPESLEDKSTGGSSSSCSIGVAGTPTPLPGGVALAALASFSLVAMRRRARSAEPLYSGLWSRFSRRKTTAARR